MVVAKTKNDIYNKQKIILCITFLKYFLRISCWPLSEGTGASGPSDCLKYQFFWGAYNKRTICQEVLWVRFLPATHLEALQKYFFFFPYSNSVFIKYFPNLSLKQLGNLNVVNIWTEVSEGLFQIKSA